MNYKKIKVELGNIKRGGAVTDEQIANALNEYFAKNPVKDGEDGGYYKPMLMGDGTLMFTPSKNDMLPLGSVGNVKGKDGYTPQKGVDYFDGADGYTPQKGIDYFDGKDGDKGDNGGYYRPHLTPEGHLVFTASEEGMLEVGDLGRIKGTDGRGIATIERINGTGLPGTNDTYKITFTDESAFTFDVYNGKDGADDAPPDYEQNDSTALDYIKNRPFYSVTTNLYSDKDKANNYNGISVNFDLEVGKNYVVSINETEYRTVCKETTYNDSVAKELECGDYAIYIVDGLLYLAYPDGEGNASVTLEIKLEDIKKLDKKYLPDDIGGGGVGKDGKSAYEYAKEAGYEGTEEEFAEKLAVNPDWIATKKVDGGEETYISQQTLTSGLWSKLQMNFQVGLTYDVYFNDEIYPCVAGNEDGGIYLGNITLMNSDSKKEHNNEPFCIYWAGAGATGGFFYKKSTVSYPITLKVTSHADYVYNKMPKEYLPEGVAMKEDIPDVPEIPKQVQPDLSQNDLTAPDYVKNRTHYEETVVVNEPLNITWDGNTEGLVSVASFYKVSDAVLTDEQIKSATVVFNGEPIAVGDVFDTIEVSEELVGSDFIAFCRKAGATFGPFTFPEIGIYFVSMGEMYVSSLTTTEPVEQTKTVVHKLDKKYLPLDTTEVQKLNKIVDGATYYTSASSYDIPQESGSTLKVGDKISIHLECSGSVLDTEAEIGDISEAASGTYSEVHLANTFIHDSLSIRYIYYYYYGDEGTFRIRFTDSTNEEYSITIYQVTNVTVIDKKHVPTLEEMRSEFILPETTLSIDPEEGVGFIPQDLALNAGDGVSVIYNGAEYDCIVVDVEDGIKALGNMGGIDENFSNTGEPFVIVYSSLGGDDTVWFIAPFDGSSEVKISIKTYVPIPQAYLTNAFPYYVEATYTKRDDGQIDIHASVTVAELSSMIQSGRDIKVRLNFTDDAGTKAITYFYMIQAVASQIGYAVIFQGWNAPFVLRCPVQLIFTPQADGSYSIIDSNVYYD